MALFSSVFFGGAATVRSPSNFQDGFQKYQIFTFRYFGLGFRLVDISNVHNQVPLAAPCEEPENSVCLPTPGTHSQQPGTPSKVSKWLTWSAKRKLGLRISIWNQILVISDYGKICNPNWELSRKTWKDGKSDEDLYFLPPSPLKDTLMGWFFNWHIWENKPHHSPDPREKRLLLKCNSEMKKSNMQCCGSPGLQTKHTKAPIKWSALSCQHSVAAISKRGFP